MEQQPDILQDSPDFSLVLGGPFFQLFRRAHLSGTGLELLHRRIAVITAVAWVPLAIFSFASGSAFGSAGSLPFFKDIETQVRFLVVLPILIAAELIVHLRLRQVVQNFVKREIIRPEELSRFNSAIHSAMRLRNSVILEVSLLLLVCTVGYWIWRNQIALGTASWYASYANGRAELTVAGYWNAFVSVPIFQFILLRWYVRLLIWFRFLWQVSRLKLQLIATHPDRAGGISFLGRSSYAFGPILFAQGAMLSGLIASRVLYNGQKLLSFKMDAIGFIAFFVLFILGPLVMFSPQLAQAKRKGLGDYGVLAQRYVRDFEKTWIKQEGTGHSELLGSADIQSLADLGNSYDIIREMKSVPFGIQDISRLAIVTAAPLVPLGLVIFSFEELVTRLLKVIF